MALILAPALPLWREVSTVDRTVGLGVVNVAIVAFVARWYGRRIGLSWSPALLLAIGYAEAVGLVVYWQQQTDWLLLPFRKQFPDRFFVEANFGLVAGVIVVALLVAFALGRLRAAAFLRFTLAYLILEIARLLLVALAERSDAIALVLVALALPGLLGAVLLSTFGQRASTKRDLAVLLGCMALMAAAVTGAFFLLTSLHLHNWLESTFNAIWFLPNLLAWPALRLARPAWRGAAAPTPPRPAPPSPAPAQPRRPASPPRRLLQPDGSTGMTPLHRAAERGDLAETRALLGQGVPADIVNAATAATPLHYAAENGHTTVVQELVEHGADVNWRARQDNTPLIAAAVKGHEFVVRYLLDHRANVDAVNRDGATALFMAAQRGHTGTVRRLLASADPNVVTARGASPLHVAAEYGHVEIASLLLGRGAQADRPTTANGDTPLHDAAQHGHTSIAIMLLGAGANPNRTDRAGNTPLHVAASAGHIEILRQLLAKGADRTRRNQAGYTAAGVSDDRHVIALLSASGP